MIQHVSVETRREDAEACLAFLELLGFHRVEPPEGLRGRTAWVQRGTQQVHLLLQDDPQVPPRGHFAVVEADLEATLDRLRAAGFEAEERSPYWGSPRYYVRDPAGHLVELMAFPPG